MKKNYVYGEYFCGNKISEYGLKNGYIDYATFAKAFDAVLNNNIIEQTQEIGYWEPVNGIDYAELEDKKAELEYEKESLDDDIFYERVEGKEKEETEEKIAALEKEIEELEDEINYQPEIYQYYIVSDQGAELIQEYTNDPLFYNETLDMYVWGVTHYGTSWNYVLTDARCNVGYNEEKEE